MTKDGAKQLEDELHRLKTVERPQIIQAIAEARSQGDLSENAEYESAKEKQAFIEWKISDIGQKLGQAHIIDPKTIDHGGRIIFGAIVKLFDMENDKEISYQIVGEDEADLRTAKISVNSPVAKSLIGKEVGTVIEVKAPSGLKEYEILDFYV